MKKTALRLVLSLLSLLIFTTLSVAQTSPFARPGLTIGAYYFNFFDGARNTTARYMGDTTVCGETLLVYTSEWDGTIFLRVAGGKIFSRNPFNPCTDTGLLYDFDLTVGDTFGTYLKVVDTQMKPLLNGEMRRYLKLMSIGGSGTIEWMEGIGDLEVGMFPLPSFEAYNRLVCVRDSTGDLWYHPLSTDALCDSITCVTPKADFASVSKNQEVAFSNLSTNAYEWLWDFGDGTFSTEKSPQHEYAAPGCYDVCLTARTPCLQRAFRTCKAVNAGESPRWRKLPFPALPADQYLTDVDFVSPDTGWVLSNRGIWRTNDGGESWQQQTLPTAPAPSVRQYTALDMLGAEHGIISCGIYDHGTPNPLKSNILSTQNGGATWVERNQGSQAYLLENLFAEGGKAYAVGQYSGWLRSTDYGQTWEKKNLPQLIDLYALAHIGGDTVCGFGSLGIQPQVTTVFAKSTDAGNTWKVLQLPQYIEQSTVFFTDANNGWAGRGLGMMLHTTDGGASWEKYPLDVFGSVTSIQFADAKNGWAVGTNGLTLHTTDGGLSWLRENCAYPSVLWEVSVPAPDVAYAVTGLKEVLKYCGDCDPVSSASETPRATSIHLSMQPNPAASQVWVETSAPFSSGCRLLAFNALGQKMLEMPAPANGGGAWLDVSGWPTGFYVVQICSERKVLASGRVAVLR